MDCQALQGSWSVTQLLEDLLSAILFLIPGQAALLTRFTTRFAFFEGVVEAIVII